MANKQYTVEKDSNSLESKLFKDYGDDIKEFQWLLFVWSQTGKKLFPYEKKFDPFLSMGWLKRFGEFVDLGDPLLVGELFSEKPARQPKKPKPRKETLKDFLGKYLEKPADFYVNTKYEAMAWQLDKKFGADLVEQVVLWYDENKGKLGKDYDNINYPQFCKHQMFLMLKNYRENGITQSKPTYKVPNKQENEGYGDRVC